MIKRNEIITYFNNCLPSSDEYEKMIKFVTDKTTVKVLRSIHTKITIPKDKLNETVHTFLELFDGDYFVDNVTEKVRKGETEKIIICEFNNKFDYGYYHLFQFMVIDAKMRNETYDLKLVSITLQFHDLIWFFANVVDYVNNHR